MMRHTSRDLESVRANQGTRYQCFMVDSRVLRLKWGCQEAHNLQSQWYPLHL